MVQLHRGRQRCVICRLSPTLPLCVLLAFAAEHSAKVRWALGRVAATHAHRTARSTHALHNAPRCPSVDTLRMTAVEHTHSSSSTAAAAASRIKAVGISFSVLSFRHLLLFTNSYQVPGTSLFLPKPIFILIIADFGLSQAVTSPDSVLIRT